MIQTEIKSTFYKMRKEQNRGKISSYQKFLVNIKQCTYKLEEAVLM